MLKSIFWGFLIKIVVVVVLVIVVVLETEKGVAAIELGCCKFECENEWI